MKFFIAFVFYFMFFLTPTIIHAKEVKLNGTLILTDTRDKSERVFDNCEITINTGPDNKIENNDFPPKYSAKCDNMFFSERWNENSPMKTRLVLSEQQKEMLRENEISHLSRDIILSYHANIRIENIRNKTEKVLLNCKVDTFIEDGSDLNKDIFPKTFSSQCENLFLTERWNNENTKISVLIDADKYQQIIDKYEIANEKHCYYRKREDERKNRRKRCSYVHEGNIDIP